MRRFCDLVHQNGFGIEGSHQQVCLLLRQAPIAGFDGFGYSGQLKMGVRVASTIKKVLKPRPTGNPLLVGKIRFPPEATEN
jgi:hypothetical protein